MSIKDFPRDQAGDLKMWSLHQTNPTAEGKIQERTILKIQRHPLRRIKLIDKVLKAQRTKICQISPLHISRRTYK